MDMGPRLRYNEHTNRAIFKIIGHDDKYVWYADLSS